jgi:hypothetical protein
MVRKARTLLERSASRAMPIPSRVEVTFIVGPQSARRATMGSSREAR